MKMRLTRFKFEWILYFLIALSLGAVLYLNSQRVLAEQRNHRVEIVADFDSLVSLSSLTGTPLNQVLSLISKSGVTSLAVPEDNLITLARAGKLVYYHGYEVLQNLQVNQLNAAFQYLMRYTKVQPHYTYVSISDTFLFDRVKAAFLRELGENNVKILGTSILELQGRKSDILRAGMGYASSDIRSLQNYGFTIIPRLVNSGRLNTNKIALKLNNISEAGKFKTLIFNKDQVLGYPRQLSMVAQKMKRYHLNFGWVEFGKQKGDRQLAKLMKERTLRVHSIPVRELPKLSHLAAQSRYVRAVEERGIRILYVRPWLNFEVNGNLLQYNIDYFQSLRKKLESRGYKIAVLKTPRLYLLPPSSWLLSIVLFGVWLTLILLARQLWPFSSSWLYGLTGLALVATIVSILLPGVFVRKMYALLCASFFPAFLILISFQDFETRIQTNKRISLILSRTTLLAGGSLLVGFVISALLGSTPFLLNIATFSGVKIAFLLPLIIVTGFLLFASSHQKGFLYKAQRILESQLKVSHVLLGLSAVSVLGLLVLRSGNSSPSLLSPWEHLIRLILEKVFIIRPRFKEFVIGYPAVVLLCWFAGHAISKRWHGLFILGGTLATISVVNSFCHLHTPLLYSLWRTANGLALGLIVGLIAVLVTTILIRAGKLFFD